MLLVTLSTQAAPTQPPPPSSPTAPKSSEQENIHDLFEDQNKEEMKYSMPVERSAWDLHLAVGWTWPDMKTGIPGAEFSVAVYDGFWSHTRLSIALYGLSNVLIAPGGQYTFFLVDNRLRLQFGAGLAFFLGGEYATTAWFNRSTVGLHAAMGITYAMTSKWGLTLLFEAPAFFPSGLKARPLIMGGFTHSFF